jgi:uncharacterized membrane protein YeaQ/YmgE (transglycosylase-associated protein family)
MSQKVTPADVEIRHTGWLTAGQDGYLRNACRNHPTRKDCPQMIGAIILGIVAGFIARALMPGKDPMGFFMTIALGLAGALVGFLIFTELLGIGDNEIFDLGGLIGAIIGAMILLGIYRVVAKPDHSRDRAGRVGAH